LSPEDDIVRVLVAQKGRLLTFLEERVGSRADAACFEHGCLDCFCRTARAVGSGAARPPPRDGETL
jgi:hypothetical protein